jgi:hypothetical protein
MAYPIEKKLVVGITSSALFDFSVEHEIYVKKGSKPLRSIKAIVEKSPPLQAPRFLLSSAFFTSIIGFPTNLRSKW